MLGEQFLLYLFSESCCMLGLAALVLLEGEHVLANIQRNHPINSCIHCGHFSSLFGKFLESLGARPRVKAKAGKKRLILLQHKRNLIPPAPHLVCVSVYSGDQG